MDPQPNDRPRPIAPTGGATPPAEPAASPPGLAGPLSHLGPADAGGRRAAVMVDVGGKPSARRTALARALVVFPSGLLGPLLAGAGPKGPIEEVARIAGILGAKRTGELIPMCHPLGLDHVAVEVVRLGPDTLEVRCSAACEGRTGVEMEALVGASIAALTVYDMTKAASKGVRIERVELLEKTGGKGGTWRADGA